MGYHVDTYFFLSFSVGFASCAEEELECVSEVAAVVRDYLCDFLSGVAGYGSGAE